MASQSISSEKQLFCAISNTRYKTKFLNSHGAGYKYSQDSSAINLGMACYDKPVALPSKKITIIRRIWRFSGMKPFQRNVTS